MGNFSAHFDLEEFLCKCGQCDPKQLPRPTPLLIQKLEELREAYNAPIRVTSGVRCPERNTAVGGRKDSEHLIGMGVDIAVENSVQRFLLLRHAIRHFARIGLGRDFLHLGVSREHDQFVLWTYYA